MLGISSTSSRLHATVYLWGSYTLQANPGVTVSKETLTFMAIVTPGHRDLAFGELQQLIDQYLILSLASSHQMKINLKIL